MIKQSIEYNYLYESTVYIQFIAIYIECQASNIQKSASNWGFTSPKKIISLKKLYPFKKKNEKVWTNHVKCIKANNNVAF